MVVGVSSSKTTLSHKDIGYLRLVRDENDVANLVAQFEASNPFDSNSIELVCMSTNDVATAEWSKPSFITQHGKTLIKKFVQERLQQDSSMDFRVT